MCCINKKDVYVAIEQIKEGTYVKTLGYKSYKKCKKVVKSTIVNSEEPSINKLYCLHKTADYKLIDDLYVTGGHALLHDKLSDKEAEKMTKLAEFYNNYEVIIPDASNMSSKQLEEITTLTKYYNDYSIVLDGKKKLIAYYDERFEEVNDTRLFNIYHIVLENENKYGSYGLYANGVLAESTSEASLSRFPNYVVTSKIERNTKQLRIDYDNTLRSKVEKKNFVHTARRMRSFGSKTQKRNQCL